VALGWSFNVAAVGRDAGLTVVARLAVLAWWSAFVNHRTARS